MNLTEQLQQINRQKENIERQIKNCQHEYGEAQYDAEIKKEFIYETVARGSDIYPEIIGSHEKQVDRWSRECTKCGFKQYTYEKEPVIDRYEPKFK